MSIKSALLAATPTVLWEFADPTGPAVVDSSGNAHNGTYGGTSFSLNQPGPEAGTHCCLFTGSGVATALATGLLSAPPWSFHVWLAMRYNATDNATLFGLEAAGVGESIDWKTGCVNATQYGYVQQGVRISGTSACLYDGSWHQLVWTRDNANNVRLYQDGATIYSAAGITMNNPGAAGVLHVAGNAAAPTQCFYYAAALFNRQLSATDVSNLYGGRTTPIQTPPNIATVTGADLTTIQADLDAILAAVRKTFPTT